MATNQKRWDEIKNDLFEISNAQNIKTVYAETEAWACYIEQLEEKNRILEEQLKNAIVPKYTVDNKLYYIDSCGGINSFVCHKIEATRLRHDETFEINYIKFGGLGSNQYFLESQLFATEIEAQSELDKKRS